MTMFCQCIIVAWFVINTFMLLWKDMIRANKEGPVEGFVGMVVTFVLLASMLSCVYGAGAMSELLP